MTVNELELKVFELDSYIADKHKDIQMLAGSLKNPEDTGKNLITYAKINDAIDEIKRSINEKEELLSETLDEDY